MNKCLSILLLLLTAVYCRAEYNVLFITIDDLRPDLGCYGNDEVVTPNIDALASEGIVFDRAYCQQAVCLASRMSMLSGLNPAYELMWELESNKRKNNTPEIVAAARARVTSLTEQFRDHGYKAIGFGKMYDYRQRLPVEDVWDEYQAGFRRNRYLSEEANELNRAFHNKKADPSGVRGKSERPAYEIADTDDDDIFSDGFRAALAVEAIENHDFSQPLFLGVGFLSPHLPFVAPKKYWDLYDRDALTLTPRDIPPENHSEYLFSEYKEIDSYGHPDPITEDFVRTMLHGYYATASYVDAMVERVIDALKARGQFENTIIAIWGDHGFKIGDYGEWAKHTNLEIDTRVPLIIRLPEGLHGGQVTQALVESTDILPTLCELAGLPIPESAQGLSLLPVISGQEDSIRDTAISQYTKPNGHMGYSIRTDNWRYHETRNRRNDRIVSQELYDLRDGLVEEKNVVDEYPDVAEKHEKLMAARLDSLRQGGH